MYTRVVTHELHTHTHTHTHTHAHTITHNHAHKHTQTHTHIYTYTQTYTHTSTHTCKHTHIHTCTQSSKAPLHISAARQSAAGVAPYHPLCSEFRVQQGWPPITRYHARTLSPYHLITRCRVQRGWHPITLCAPSLGCSRGGTLSPAIIHAPYHPITLSPAAGCSGGGTLSPLVL